MHFKYYDYHYHCNLFGLGHPKLLGWAQVKIAFCVKITMQTSQTQLMLHTLSKLSWLHYLTLKPDIYCWKVLCMSYPIPPIPLWHRPFSHSTLLHLRAVSTNEAFFFFFFPWYNQEGFIESNAGFFSTTLITSYSYTFTPGSCPM